MSQHLAGLADVDAPSATLLAIRNALKLGGSLVFTWGIALAIRLLLPRYLGPSLFGTLNFADALAATFFISLNLGVETYIRKEVAVRPAHASDFFGGVFVLRVLMTALLLGGLAALTALSHQPAPVRRLVGLFAIAQFFVTANGTLSAMLHAKGHVGGMSMLAVATKVVWAVGVLAAMVTHAGLWAFAVAYLASESIETLVLYRLAQRHLGLAFRVDRTCTWAALVASLSYYLNLFATTAYGKLDVSLLEFMGNSREVGFYSAASAVAALTLLVTPLIGWVLIPMFARAAARSPEELYRQVCRSLELILSVAIPVSLLLSLGAETWVRIIFGSAFAPAAPALRVLATMFVLTYVAIVCSITLIMIGRAWTLTAISIAGLAVNAALNLAIIRSSMRVFGEGGGGTGCALAMLATEIFVTSCMLVVVGRHAFDRRGVTVLAKSLAACGVVAVAYRALAWMGDSRILLAGCLYFLLVVWMRALRVKDIAEVVAGALRQRA